MYALAALSYTLMGVVSGLPAALLTSTIQAWLADAHASVWLIGILGFLSFPYAGKPLLSVVLNFVRASANVGNHTVLLFVGVLLSCALLYLGQCDPVLAPGVLAWVLCISCVLSSMADICIDGVRVEIKDRDQQALAGAFYVGAYRVAFISAAGLGLLWASHYGWASLYRAGAGIVLLLTITLRIINAGSYKHRAIKQLTVKSLSRWITGPRVWGAVLGVLLLKSHDQFVESLMQVYLLNYLALSLETVAIMYKTVGITASILGGLIAGWAMTMVQDDKLILWSVATKMLCMTVFLYAMTLLGDVQLWTVAAALALECFASGFTATMVVVIMTKLCDQDYGSTQFALLSSLVFGLRALMAPLAAAVLSGWGWYGFFITALALLLLPGAMTIWKGRRIGYEQKEVMA